MILPIALSFGASIFICVVLSAIGKHFKLVQGKHNVSAIGGLAVIGAWWSVAIGFGALSEIPLTGLIVATTIITVLGIIDVARPLPPIVQLTGQVSAALAVIIGSGVTVRFVTHPFIQDSFFRLDQWNLWGIALPGTFLVLIWIVTLMNAVNFLDGMDGLASGVSGIAFITIGLVSLLPYVGDNNTALLSLIAAAALGGFLFWNLPPAHLYLGTAGPWFIGLLLAILSVQGVSKIATAAVVGSVPLLDALTVIVGRIRRGQSPFYGDYTHFHHRLLRRGFSERAILLMYYFVSIVLGAGAVMLQTRYKVVILIIVSILFFLMIMGGSYVVRKKRAAGTSN